MLSFVLAKLPIYSVLNEHLIKKTGKFTCLFCFYEDDLSKHFTVSDEHVCHYIAMRKIVVCDRGAIGTILAEKKSRFAKSISTNSFCNRNFASFNRILILDEADSLINSKV